MAVLFAAYLLHVQAHKVALSDAHLGTQSLAQAPTALGAGLIERGELDLFDQGVVKGAWHNLALGGDDTILGAVAQLVLRQLIEHRHKLQELAELLQGNWGLCVLVFIPIERGPACGRNAKAPLIAMVGHQELLVDEAQHNLNARAHLIGVKGAVLGQEVFNLLKAARGTAIILEQMDNGLLFEIGGGD